MMIHDNNWNTIITPKSSLFRLNLKEIWEYRDLIKIFVWRDIVSIYKQTVMGPVWFMLGPLFTVFTYTFIFSQVAKISTDGLPGPLFYLSGTTLWNYFQSCFSGASSTFSTNSSMFGKVYFPRLVSPISMVLSNLLKFSIQMITFICFLIYYYFQPDSIIHLQIEVVLVPVLVLITGGIAMGGGIIISSLTTKYRDFTMFIGVFLSLLMYATPIMYPESALPTWSKSILKWNPLAPLIETFRFIFTGRGSFEVSSLFYSFVFMILILIIGVVIFNKTEKTFIDTV
jgi:lipopolysaccharide transport system permease protein